MQSEPPKPETTAWNEQTAKVFTDMEGGAVREADDRLRNRHPSELSVG